MPIYIIIMDRNRKGILYALCHAAVYILALAILFTIGIFVPTRDLPIANSTFRNVIQELETNRIISHKLIYILPIVFK